MSQANELYRDGEWLVVPLDTSSLSNQCLWTNMPTNGEAKEYTIVDPKASLEFGVVYGFRMKTDRRKVRLPVSEDWEGDKEAKKLMMSRKLLRISVPCLVIGFALVAALLAVLPQGQIESSAVAATAFIACVGLGTLGICGVVIGFALPHLEGVPGVDETVQVGLITDTHFWLRNSHQDILAAAPPWPGPSRKALLAERPGFLQSAFNNWPVLATWLLIVAVVALVRALIRHAN